MLKAMDVAKYIVSKCAENGKPVYPIVLQKYLYYIQHRWLKKVDKPLFDDDFRAWGFGAVVEDVYYHFVFWGVNLCTLKSPNYENIIENKAIRDIVDSQINYLQEWDILDLTRQLYDSKNAWYKIYSKYEKDANFKSIFNKSIIPKELIKEDKLKRKFYK